MAFSADAFLAGALEIGEDIVEAGLEFAKDLDLEDAATIATTGLTLAQLNELRKGPDRAAAADRAGADKVKPASVALSEAAERVRGGTADTELGADTERTRANRAATRRGLRVRRSFDPGPGLAANPLSIQI